MCVCVYGIYELCRLLYHGDSGGRPFDHVATASTRDAAGYTTRLVKCAPSASTMRLQIS